MGARIVCEYAGVEKLTSLDDIDVARLRTTFFWPLTLDRLPGERPVLDSSEYLEAHEKWLLADGSPWRSIHDGLRHLPMPPPSKEDDFAAPDEANLALADAYAEFVYFHDFVQQMLYGKTGGPGAGPLRLFQRNDISELQVTLRSDQPAISLAVERVNLYLLSYGVAVLALQVSTRESAALSLSSVLRLNDLMRRSHVPFYEPRQTIMQSALKNGTEKRTEIAPQQVPEKVVWFSQGEAVFQWQPEDEGKPGPSGQDHRGESSRSDPPYATLLSRGPDHDRRVLPALHWRWLLNGPENAPERIPLANTRQGYRWRHFSDDRLPILTTVILKDRSDYYNLSEGHWMRLAFVDSPGSDPYPYAPAFLKETFAQHCYDRYHHDKFATTDAPLRYLMCDYAMTAVTYRWHASKTDVRSGQTTGWKNDYASVIEMHMQRHYYQMFLLQVIDKAVMLGLSSRITQAVHRFGERDQEADLTASLQDIERDFLKYVHRFRFTGVSGQLQATQIYEQLRRVMGLDAIFDDIKTELDTAVAFLSSREAERVSEEARHATEAAERLNIVASLGVVIALVLGFFSMNIVTTSELVEALFKALSLQSTPGREPLTWMWHLLVFAAGLSVISGAAWVLSFAIHKLVGRRGKGLRPAEAFIRNMLLAMAFLGLLLVLLAFSQLAIFQ